MLDSALFISHRFLGNLDFIGPVHLIQFTFRRLEIPPNYSTNHLGKFKSSKMGMASYCLPLLSDYLSFSVIQLISLYISPHENLPIFSENSNIYMPKVLNLIDKTLHPNTTDHSFVQVMFFLQISGKL